MKCGVCGFDFDIDDLIDWGDVFDESNEYEIYGQHSACPECGEELWISSDEIEHALTDEKERTCAKKDDG